MIYWSLAAIYYYLLLCKWVGANISLCVFFPSNPFTLLTNCSHEVSRTPLSPSYLISP
jgi:hypothetical protein